MTDTVLTREHGPLTIRIVRDENPLNPRVEWDNLGTMVGWSREYNVGEERARSSRDFLEDLAGELVEGDLSIHDTLTEDRLLELVREHAVLLPVYVRGRGDGCFAGSPSDDLEGADGAIYVTLTRAAEEYPRDMRACAEGMLKVEVETFNHYASGEVYGWIVECGGEHLDSCWGYFDDPEGYPLEQASDAAQTILDAGLIADPLGLTPWAGRDGTVTHQGQVYHG